MGSYAIRGGADGKRRLDLLAHIMQPSTQALLARAGLAPGMRCLDLGCGGGHVSRYLAECVGAGGMVVGIDIDGVKLDAARTLCAQASLTNVQFRSVAVADWSDAAAYDLVYARFILSHLPDRPAVLARIGQALAPGGTVVLEDIDFGGAFCHPPNGAYARYCELYRDVVARRGGNAELGRELYGLCLAAGFEQAEVRVLQPAHCRGPEKTLQLATLVNIADAIVAEGLADAAEIAAMIDELQDYCDDPRTIVGLPRVFQVCAHKAPAGAGAAASR